MYLVTSTMVANFYNGCNRRQRTAGAGLWTGTVHSGDAMCCCGSGLGRDRRLIAGHVPETPPHPCSDVLGLRLPGRSSAFLAFKFALRRPQATPATFDHHRQ